jgi:hypothetical protein
MCAEYMAVGEGGAASLTACACGHITTFDVGFITIGSRQYIAAVGFTCSSGQRLADPGAGSLTLSATNTTLAVRWLPAGLLNAVHCSAGIAWHVLDCPTHLAGSDHTCNIPHLVWICPPP